MAKAWNLFPVLAIFVVVLSCCCSSFASDFQKLKCAGRYCGRISNESARCEACPRGYRSDGYICQKCTHSLKLYEWLYLGFMALTSLALHFFFIDYFSQRSRRNVFVLYLCASVESSAAAVLTLLMAEPQGSLKLHSCNAQALSDWYTIFFNPKPDYVNTIYCTQEAVYPLYTIVLLYYFFSLLLSVLLRPIVSHKLCKSAGAASIYAALYFLPILTVSQAVFGGLIFYLYPYITLVVSIIGTAVVLAKNKITNICQLVRSKRHIVILVAYMIIHAFGQLAITELKQPSLDGPLFVLVVAPTAFYLLTSSLTEPSKFKH